jgi:hypothetical protein
MSTRAYDELVKTILSPEDREKFEWAIGCMLDNGPCHVVTLLGDAATGKTTLTNIVRKVLLSPFTGNVAPRVAFLEAGRAWKPRDIASDSFLFYETNRPNDIIEGSLVIWTTGHRVPVNKHFVLMDEIDAELTVIADNCIALFRELGETYYQENNNES